MYFCHGSYPHAVMPHGDAVQVRLNCSVYETKLPPNRGENMFQNPILTKSTKYYSKITKSNLLQGGLEPMLLLNGI